MDFTDFFWGLLTVGAGIFIAVYGMFLFKFALAAMGFGVGFIGGWWLLQDSDNDIRFLISLVAGAVVGLVLFTLVRFGIYIAGAILGLVISVIIAGLLNIWGLDRDSWLVSILAIAGIVGGGFFGPRLGSLIILLATAAAGALLIVDGMQTWFAGTIPSAGADASATLGSRFAITSFALLMAISFLSQFNARKLGRRVIN